MRGHRGNPGRPTKRQKEDPLASYRDLSISVCAVLQKVRVPSLDLNPASLSLPLRKTRKSHMRRHHPRTRAADVKILVLRERPRCKRNDPEMDQMEMGREEVVLT